MRYRILTLNNISARGLERLPRERYEIASDLDRPDAILVRSADMHGNPISDSVRAVGRAGAGVNNIPVAEFSKRGIPVFNTPGANANAVKELVLAGLLLAARNVCPAWEFARSLEGDDHAIDAAVESGKMTFVGFEMPGRTLGVVGLGAIGVEVANSALALGMKVLGYDPQITVQRAWQLSASVEQALSLDDLFARADAVTVHVPLNDHTRKLVNDTAVIAALDAGRLHAYVCDFPNTLLKDHAKVVTLPHLGASTGEAEENCAIMVAEQVRDLIADCNLRNSVNYPG